MKLLTTIAYFWVVLLSLSTIGGCQKDIADPEECPDDVAVLTSFVTREGQPIRIYEDGAAYLSKDGLCAFVLQYFNPDFFLEHYVSNESGTFLIADSGELLAPKNEFFEDFEKHTTFTDLFIQSVADFKGDMYWNQFTVQSPAARTVPNYVALRKYILDGSCTFIDNKIELATDPTNPMNRVLKFTSVPPGINMITAKSSISSTLGYFVKGSELWYQADYYIESGMPFSIVDFENGYFDQSPGPRVCIRSNALTLENKFGAKQNYTHTTGITVPKKEWFTVTVHLVYSDEEDGLIELWQDGALLMSTTGINLPTSNSIQNIVEVGISATPVGSVMYFDNMRISETPF